jgi:capsular exopolysaccharide synthesis family protein
MAASSSEPSQLDRNVPINSADAFGIIDPAYGLNDPASPSQGSSLGVPLLLTTFARSWKVIVPAGVLLAIGSAALVVWLFRPDYPSYALIEIEDAAPYIAFQPGTAYRGGNQYVQTQIELMRSPVVLEPVLARPEVAQLQELQGLDDRLAYLKDRLSVTQVNGSELYRIEFNAKEPQGARDVVKAVIAAYFDAQRRDEFERTTAVVQLLDDEYKKRQMDIDGMRKRIFELTEEIAGTDASTRSSISGDTVTSILSSIGSEMVEADVQREELKAQIRAYQESTTYVAPSSGEVRLLEMEVNAHPDVSALQQEIERLQTALSFLEKKRSEAYRPNGRGQRSADQVYKATQDELSLRKDQLEQARRRIKRELAVARAASREGERREAVEDLNRQLATAEEKFRVLSERYESEMAKLKDASTSGVDLEFAKAELDQEERVLAMIAARKIEIQTEQRAPARVRLLREPSVPLAPVERLPLKPLAAGCLAALIAPFGLAVAREWFVQRVSDPGQLKQELAMPVLAEVAQFPTVDLTHQRHNLAKRAQHSLVLVEECIDGLRTTLALANDHAAGGVLTVTSAVSGEGKTTVAAQLAQSIARACSEPTLLIDGDMRSPDVHDLFDIPVSPGFGEVLADDSRIPEAIQQINGSCLFVMPAGAMKGSPYRRIRFEHLEQLISRLRQKYSYIVIDTPPVLSASESMLFARCADSVLLCCMRDVSRVRQVQSAVERLVRAKAKPCGAVLSGTPTRTYAYRYGAYAYANEHQGDR